MFPLPIFVQVRFYYFDLPSVRQRRALETVFQAWLTCFLIQCPWLVLKSVLDRLIKEAYDLLEDFVRVVEVCHVV